MNRIFRSLNNHADWELHHPIGGVNTSQHVQNKISIATTSNEINNQSDTAEETPRGMSPKHPAEHTSASITSRQGRGDPTAQRNGTQLEQLQQSQLQIWHFSQALTALITQHNSVLQQIERIDQSLIGQKGIQREPFTQKVDQILQKEAAQQNLVEQLGSSQLNDILPVLTHPLAYSPPQMQLRSGRIVSNTTTPAQSPVLETRAPTPPPPIPEPLVSDIEPAQAEEDVGMTDTTPERSQEPTEDPIHLAYHKEVAHRDRTIQEAMQKVAELQHREVQWQEHATIEQQARAKAEMVAAEAAQWKKEAEEHLAMQAREIERLKHENESREQQLQQAREEMQRQQANTQAQQARYEQANERKDAALRKVQAELQRKKEAAQRERAEVRTMNEEALAELKGKLTRAQDAKLDVSRLEAELEEMKENQAREREAQQAKAREEKRQLLIEHERLMDEKEEIEAKKRSLAKTLDQRAQQLEENSGQLQLVTEALQQAQRDKQRLIMDKDSAEQQAALANAEIQRQRMVAQEEQMKVRTKEWATNASKQGSSSVTSSQVRQEVQQVEERLLNIIDETKAELNVAIGETKAELNNAIDDTKEVLTHQMAQNQEEVHDVIEGTRANLTLQLQETRTEFSGQIGALSGQITDINVQIIESQEKSAAGQEQMQGSLAQLIGMMQDKKSEATPAKPPGNTAATGRSSSPNSSLRSYPPPPAVQQPGPPGFPMQPQYVPQQFPETQRETVQQGFEMKPTEMQRTYTGRMEPVKVVQWGNPVAEGQSFCQTGHPSSEPTQPDTRDLRSLQASLPIFTGGPNVEGFLTKFRNITKAMQVPEVNKYVLLLGALKGAADQWLQTQAWNDWTYDEIVQALRTHFGRIQDTAVARLEAMSYKDDLHKFNSEFTKLGASCVGLCSEYMQKRIYLKSIRPHHFQQQLRGFSGQMSLQELMATAVELEPGYKNRYNTEGNSGGTSNRPIIGRRGGKRIECPKCNKTHWDDEKCPTWSKAGPNKPDFRGKTSRVNEGEFEGLPDTQPESPAAETNIEEGGYDTEGTVDSDFQ